MLTWKWTYNDDDEDDDVKSINFLFFASKDVQISDFVRHLLIEQLPNGVRVYGSEIEPIFGEFWIANLFSREFEKS